MIAVVVANALQKIIVASAKAGHVKSAELLGRVTKWAIWIFAILTALITLGIAPQLLQMLLTAIFAGGALAIGLAFGLGGKDVAARLIEKTSHAVLEKE
jgi:small-conductance mechanosensitive channel